MKKMGVVMVFDWVILVIEQVFRLIYSELNLIYHFINGKDLSLYGVSAEGNIVAMYPAKEKVAIAA